MEQIPVQTPDDDQKTPLPINKGKAPAKDYPHEPLPSDGDTIRILKLGQGSGDDPLIGSLFTAALTEPVPFDALSYAWGNPTKEFTIICNDTVMGITANLHAALINLRYPDKERLIWTDALCINQEDLAEKGSQVSIMSKIYSAATRTVVWLGPEHESTKLAIDTLNSIATDCLMASGIWFDNINDVTQMDPRDFVRNIIVKAPPEALNPKAHEEEWDALFAFFNHTWWERIWVRSIIL